MYIFKFIEKKKKLKRGGNFFKKTYTFNFFIKKKTQVEGEQGKIALEARIQKH
jgi:hypothetical protein